MESNNILPVNYIYVTPATRQHFFTVGTPGTEEEGNEQSPPDLDGMRCCLTLTDYVKVICNPTPDKHTPINQGTKGRHKPPIKKTKCKRTSAAPQRLF
jgi:hypothetical protein